VKEELREIKAARAKKEADAPEIKKQRVSRTSEPQKTNMHKQPRNVRKSKTKGKERG
jgi:hypothetical protein